MKCYYREQSKQSKSGAMFNGAFILVVLAALVYTTYSSIKIGRPIIDELFVEIVVGGVLLKQALSHYTYEVTDEGLRIHERMLWRKRTIMVPYRLIDGIYEFKQQLLGPIKYRYKYRMVSSLDNRAPWALCYGIEGGKKLKHGRMILKAEPEFFEALKPFLPDRVCVPEGDVVMWAYLRADAYAAGETDVPAYYERVKAEVEAQQHANETATGVGAKSDKLAE